MRETGRERTVRNPKAGMQFPKKQEYNLETRVTDMIHEIGIPAHIKGYHYLRDAIIMAVDDMDVFECDYEGFVSYNCQDASDNGKQSGKSNSSRDRSCMEPWKA